MEITARLAHFHAHIFEVPVSYSGRTYQMVRRSHGGTDSRPCSTLAAVRATVGILNPRNMESFNVSPRVGVDLASSG
jgi:hypothetical protein